MGLAGSLLGDLFGGGSTPSVPAWQNIDLGTQQQKAIASNAANLPGAEALVSSSNQFTQDQITKMLEESIPGYSSIVGSTSSNIESMLKGEIPTDVSQAVQGNAAAQALGGGYAGTGMAKNLVARDLGLTSLDLTQKGLSSAEGWLKTMNSIFAPGMMDVSSMFISPQQMFQDTMQNQEEAWNVQWLKNQVAAMPDPMMQALGNLVGGVLDTAASIGVGMLGGNTSAPQQQQQQQQTPQISTYDPSTMGGYTGMTSEQQGGIMQGAMMNSGSGMNIMSGGLGF